MPPRTSTVEYNSYDQATLASDREREAYVHDLLINNVDIQRDVWEILNLEDLDEIELIHEDRYINWITADFSLLYHDKIRAIIECKAWDIWVTDYVRWIWQIMQYEYFHDKNIWKWRDFDDEFNSVLLFPSSVIRDNSFNIWRFKYPESALIIELNDISHAVRQISNDELGVLWSAVDNGLTTISQYYIRDNRLFEIFLLLKYLVYLYIGWERNKINRKILETTKLRLLGTPNNNNWRNAFISLASLWLINSKNLPTMSWIRLWSLEYDEFILEMYKSYIKPYIDWIIGYFVEDDSRLRQDNGSICEWLREMYNASDVLFLTQSEWRYISSWLNIIRDDFWCLNYRTRSTNRELVYNITELNDNTIKQRIRENTNATEYLRKFQLLTR